MIIQHIIRLCKAWFERRLDFFARQCNGDGQSTNSGRMSSLQQASQSEQAIFGIGTCQRPNRPDDELGEDGDGHENGVPDLLETESSSRKFACPFLKYNPEKYRDCRGCILGGWLTVHRVKEHVYRKHRLPKFKCGRCCQDFRTSTQLLDHQRADDPCVLKTEEAQDGINEDQFQALRSRKRPRGGLSEEEKWIGVYKIIFPDEDLVPSPYHDFTFEQLGERRGSDSNSAAFVRDLGDHARRELPRLMRPRLESMLDQVIEESLTPDRIVELAQGIFQQILQTFNEAQATPNPQESNEDEAEHISLEAVDTQGIDHIHIAEDYPSLGLSSGIGFGLLGDQQNMLDGIFLDSVKDSFESYGLHF
ncbi:hypothetical protein BKA56DRAFT_673176 [Ilyonectria sp. MPI-CAGE-AT-0026]|nr:hypothetical protein BKA56DRAFT_673176 [Ilyonectria sp. MPI-CAGE-AT-0026]